MSVSINRFGIGRLAWLAVVTGLAILPPAQVNLLTLDDFQDGTTMGWGGGASPINVPDGGPSGVGDNFLQITSHGGFGAGSHLAVNNFDMRWTGDYSAAGVQRVKLWFKNFSANTLHIRIVLFQNSAERFTSTVPVVIGPNQDWTQIVFPVGPSDLTRVLGSITYAQLMSNVTAVMVRHDPDPPSSGGDPIAAQAGLDLIEVSGTYSGPPSSFTVNLGQVTSGGLASLTVIDGNSLAICKFFVPNRTSPIVQWVVDTGVPVHGQRASIVSVRYNAMAVNAGSYSLTSRLFDWNTASFDESRTDALTLAAQTFTLNGTGDLDRYLGSNGEVRARFEVRQTGPSTVTLPCAAWDLVEFTAGN